MHPLRKVAPNLQYFTIVVIHIVHALIYITVMIIYLRFPSYHKKYLHNLAVSSIETPSSLYLDN